MKFKLSWKGCLIGCGSMVLLFVVMLFSTGYWLTKKGEFKAESTLLYDESDFFVRTNLEAEDELLIDFVATQSTQMAELNPMYEHYPQFFRNWQEGKARSDMRKMLPLEIEFTGQVNADDFRASVGFSFYNNLARVAFWGVKRAMAKEGRVRSHEEREYIAIEEQESFYFTLRDSVLYFSKTQEGMHHMIEGLVLTDHTGDARFEGVDMESPVYGFLLGDAAKSPWYDILEGPNGASSEAATHLAQLSDQMTRVGFDLHLADDQTLAGNVILDMPQGPHVQEQLQSALDNYAQEAGLSTDFRVSTSDSGYRVAFTISGFREVVEQMKEEIQTKNPELNF